METTLSRPEYLESLLDKNADGVFLDADGMPISFNGNLNVKGPGVKLSLKPEHIQEYVRCFNDIVYFAETYCKLLTKIGYSNIKLRSYQKEYLSLIMKEKRLCVLAPRQSAKTTTTAIHIIHYAIFNKEKTIGISANKREQATEVLDKVRQIYLRLPIWLQPSVTSFNKRSLTFENGCRILTSATTGNAFRGFTINYLYIDEMAFIDKGSWDEFEDSIMPTVTAIPDSKIVLTSTPKGLNHFYKYYKQAEDGRSEYKHFYVDWQTVPHLTNEYRENIILTHGEVYWNQNYGCSFEGSTNTLLNGTTLKNMTILNPIERMAEANIYKKPVPDHSYVLAVDVSHGVMQDYSSIVIVDVSVTPFETALVYRSNTISPVALPNIVVYFGNMYNNAMAIVESNDVGMVVAFDLLNEYGYENLIQTTTKRFNTKVSTTGQSRLGLRTTKLTKRVGCIRLKELYETGKLVSWDSELFSELTHFVSKGNTYQAEEGYHDDIVMAMVQFAWFTTQEVFKEYTQIEFKNKMREFQLQKLDEEGPMGILTTMAEEIDESGYVSTGLKDFPVTMTDAERWGEW